MSLRSSPPDPLLSDVAMLMVFDEPLRFTLNESNERIWLEAVVGTDDAVSIESIDASEGMRWLSTTVGLRGRSIKEAGPP